MVIQLIWIWIRPRHYLILIHVSTRLGRSLSSLLTTMDPYAIRYDHAAAPETGHVEEYKLLEVSADLARAIEQAEKDGESHVRYASGPLPRIDGRS